MPTHGLCTSLLLRMVRALATARSMLACEHTCPATMCQGAGLSLCATLADHKLHVSIILQALHLNQHQL